MKYTIKLSISDNDDFSSDIRFDDENMDSVAKQTIQTNIAAMTTAFDNIRDLII